MTSTIHSTKSIERRSKWSYFGSVTKENSMKNTTIGEQVFLELTQHKRRKSTYNGIYITRAKKDGWSRNDIMALMRDEEPGKLYQVFYKKYMDARMADVNQKIVNKMSTEEPSTEILDAPKKPIGLRARMGITRKTTATQSVKPTGLAARLKENKTNSHATEQDSTLFISCIPLDYTEDDIKFHLSETNFNIRRINVVRKDDNSGTRVSLGKAFIVCSNATEALECLDYMNTCKWGNLVVSAQISKPKR